VLALGNSREQKIKTLTAKVVLVNSFDELEKKKDSLKGMIVFYNYKFNPTMYKHFVLMEKHLLSRSGQAVQQNMEQQQ
jgi:hypothetical protein